MRAVQTMRLTIFASLTSVRGRADTGEATDSVRLALTAVETSVYGTWIS